MRVRVAALVAVMVLAVTSCGARLTDQQRNFAIQAAQGTGTTTGTGPTTTGGTGPTIPGSTTGPGTGKGAAGPAGMLAEAGPLGADAGWWAQGFLFSPALTVGGGTAEVLRNIIGERILGLPRDPDPEEGRPWSSMGRERVSAGTGREQQAKP